MSACMPIWCHINGKRAGAYHPRKMQGLWNLRGRVPQGHHQNGSGTYRVYRLCANHEKGGIAKKNCKVSCIGCMKCQKVCPNDAIMVKEFLAEIDFEKCVNCGKCAEVCPQSTIHDAMHERFPYEPRPKEAKA